MVFSVSGCGQNRNKVTNAYKLNSDSFGLLHNEIQSSDESHLMGSNVCTVDGNIDAADVDMSLAEGAGLFNITKLETVYAKNVHTKLYPASTTKILTAYVVLKHGNLEDVVTVSQQNVALESDSSNCGLQAGDRITVKNLLYGLMLRSANDAANALADYISGSTESFAELMNEEAKLLGATNSHFVNAHGLHDDQHYTTVYDLYLIFHHALENETFREICGSLSYTAEYQNADGETVSAEWKNTMQYFTHNKIPPEGVTVLAGKTGTTTKALSCLVLLSRNETQEEFVSIILKAQDRGVLYDEMNELLAIVQQ